MTESDRTKHQQHVDYLVGVLQQNPLEESAAIIRSRNRLFGIREETSARPQTGADPDETRKHRKEMLWQVEKLREHVWTAPPEELRAEFAKFDIAGFPDIQATVERLKTIAANRKHLPTLAQHRDFDGDFFSILKKVLASPARDVAILREQVLVSFQKGKIRRRGKKMIRLLKKEVPALYELESTWLDSLDRRKLDFFYTVKTSPTVQIMNMPWWVYVLLIVAALLFASAVRSGQ